MKSAEEYARIAEDHWRRHRPVNYATMSPLERAEFFGDLGEQIRAQIETRQLDEELRPDPPGETPLERAGRFAWAERMNESEVLREYLPMTEADEAMEEGRLAY